MKTISLKIKDINILNEIQKVLSNHQPLTKDQKTILSNFLLQLPSADTLMSEKVLIDEQFEVKIWGTNFFAQLEKWEALFHNLPGWDFCPICYIVDKDDIDLLRKGIVIMAIFSPSYTYNVEHRGDGYEVHLKDDGTAIFSLPTIEDAEKYPELYSFKGSWKEAYLLLIETLQKGWPMEEFPEELQKFLPSKK